MSISLFRSWAISLALAPAAAFALPGGRAAPIGAVDGVIYTCVDREDGQIRVINPASGNRCHRNETMVSWTQTGTPGPMGPAGPQGPAGTDGASGPVGPSGAM